MRFRSKRENRFYRPVKKRQSRKRFLVLILVSLLSAIFILLGLFWKRENNDFPLELEGHFSLQYPGGWEAVNLSGIGLEKHLAARITHQDPKANFDISFKENVDNVNYNEIASSVKEALSKDYSGFQEVSRDDMRVGGKDAFEFIYTHPLTTESGVEKISKQRMVLVVNNSTIYYLVFQCEEKNYSSLGKEFDIILNSLEFK